RSGVPYRIAQGGRPVGQHRALAPGAKRLGIEGPEPDRRRRARVLEHEEPSLDPARRIRRRARDVGLQAVDDLVEGAVGDHVLGRPSPRAVGDGLRHAPRGVVDDRERDALLGRRRGPFVATGNRGEDDDEGDEKAEKRSPAGASPSHTSSVLPALYGDPELLMAGEAYISEPCAGPHERRPLLRAAAPSRPTPRAALRGPPSTTVRKRR